jgi:hypothetical protein
VQVVQHFGQRSNTAPVWLVEALDRRTAGDEAKFSSVTKLKKTVQWELSCQVSYV